MRIHQFRVSRREDGAVAIMVALLAVILIVLVAFTTDFGMAYAQRQALATGADSAALAVIHTEYNTQLTFPTRTCGQALTQDALRASTDPTKAENIAYAQVNANAPFGATIPASDITTTLSCESGDTVLQVRVKVDRSITPIFGGVVSASPQHIDRSALAALGVVNGVTNAMPIAVCTNQAKAIIDQHLLDVVNYPVPDPQTVPPTPQFESAQLISLNKVWPTGTPCGAGGSGNWGWLNFGAGVSVPDLVKYIKGLYPYTLTLPTVPPIPGTPGNKGNGNPVSGAMQTVMDKIVTLPVYDSVGGHGANTTYNVIGFLSVKLCGYKDNNSPVVGTTCYDSGLPLVDNSLQVRYDHYTPVGEMGELCLIGSSCAFNSYVTKLLG